MPSPEISAYKLDPRSESSVLRLTVLKLHRKWRGHRSEFSQFLTDKFLALVTHRHRGKKKKKLLPLLSLQKKAEGSNASKAVTNHCRGGIWIMSSGNGDWSISLLHQYPLWFAA